MNLSDNKRPDFVNRTGDQLTPDGEALRNFIVGLFKEADESSDMTALNSVLSGHIGHYYTNVYKLHMMTPERWMHDFGESFAAAAWRDMQWFAAQEAQTQQVQETATQTNDIAAQLQKLTELLTEVAGRVDKLEEGEPVKPKRKPRKANVTESTDEPAEAEADPETEETTDDNPEGDEAGDASEEA